jgi:hypothetical protein
MNCEIPTELGLDGPSFAFFSISPERRRRAEEKDNLSNETFVLQPHAELVNSTARIYARKRSVQ